VVRKQAHPELVESRGPFQISLNHCFSSPESPAVKMILTQAEHLSPNGQATLETVICAIRTIVLNPAGRSYLNLPKNQTTMLVEDAMIEKITPEESNTAQGGER
jgi:hypothetical protein